MKKKFLSGLLTLCLAVPCAFAFSACKNDPPPPSATFTASAGVLTKVDETITEIKAGLYNKESLGSNTTYTVEQIKSQNADFEYYVEIGTVANVDDVETLTVGTSTFDDDDTFKLSIGLGNQIEAKAFYEDDNKIYVAAPVIAFECVNNAKIKINGTEFSFDLDVTEETKEWSNVAFQAGSTNTVAKEGNEYNVTFNDAKTMLCFTYANASANDIILTRKVITGSAYTALNGVVNYGFTSPESLEGNPLGLYPIGYYADALNQAFATWYDGTTTNYDVYVVGNGIYNTVMHYTVVVPSAE